MAGLLILGAGTLFLFVSGEDLAPVDLTVAAGLVMGWSLYLALITSLLWRYPKLDASVAAICEAAGGLLFLATLLMLLRVEADALSPFSDFWPLWTFAFCLLAHGMYRYLRADTPGHRGGGHRPTDDSPAP